jgi:glycosyltransferase involved in cell wall biosynthesis
VFPDVCIVNDSVRGCHGEPVLWTHLIERLGCTFMDCATTESKTAKELRAAARGRGWRPKLWIQNASWNPPHAGGPEPYVAVLMDNLRALKDERSRDQLLVLRDAEAIVANSAHFLEDYEEFAGKMTVIPLGIDTDFFDYDHHIPPAGSQRFRGMKKRAIFVGDATAQKGWMKVVALAESREDLDWTFVLKSLIEKLMPPGRLEVGVPPEKVRELLCASDVFVLGSLHEGGSQAPLEAMACGLPVVMPPAGDFATWKPPSYFEVMAPHGSREMGIALDRALATPCDPRSDLIAAGRYSVDQVVTKWKTLLEGLL